MPKPNDCQVKPYDSLQRVLTDALLQASEGKGRDRHAQEGEPFDRHHLTFHFHPEIAPENIKEIALVMAKTAAAKIDCMNLCALEGDFNAQPGNA